MTMSTPTAHTYFALVFRQECKSNMSRSTKLQIIRATKAQRADWRQIIKLISACFWAHSQTLFLSFPCSYGTAMWLSSRQQKGAENDDLISHPAHWKPPCSLLYTATLEITLRLSLKNDRLWVSELLIRGKLYPDKYINFGESKTDVLYKIWVFTFYTLLIHPCCCKPTLRNCI